MGSTAYLNSRANKGKVNLTTGVGWQSEQCVGQTGSVPRLGLRSLCLQDSPVGVRDTDYNSVFSSGQSVAATFDRGLFYQRGYAMGTVSKTIRARFNARASRLKLYRSTKGRV